MAYWLKLLCGMEEVVGSIPRTSPLMALLVITYGCYIVWSYDIYGIFIGTYADVASWLLWIPYDQMLWVEG
jgi:hypothetical protein